MVKTHRFQASRGFITADAVVGMAIVVLVLAPLTLMLLPQREVARATVEQAVLLEILDGELEVLRAGAWREWGLGRHEGYRPWAEAVRSLPEGRFTVEVTESRIRLEWKPVEPRRPTRAAREVLLP